MGSNNTRPTTSEFIKKARLVHGDKYEYDFVQYTNASTKIDIMCPLHGRFTQKPNSHLNGHGCKDCGVIVVSNTKRNSKSEFIAKANRIHSCKYDYTYSKYTTSKIPVAIICPIHGVFHQKPNSHLQGRGCQECAKQAVADSCRHTKDHFILKAIEVHGSSYGYDDVVYTNAMTKVAISCAIHGVFWQSPSQHLRYGCKACGHKKVGAAIRDSKENFIEKAVATHDNKYQYDNVIYFNSVSKIEIFCPKHGAFYQHPYSHLNGRGCPTCSNIGPSLGEMELYDFLAKLVETKLSDRNVITPFEIDCLIPSKKLGIEFCGIYYHSDKFKDDSYHLDKLKAMSAVDHELIHVFDDEWRDKQSIVKAIIKNRLGLTPNKLYGRNTCIKEVGTEESRNFLNANHIQGDARAEIRLGLYCSDKLVMIATFSNVRHILGPLDTGWFELVRLCTGADTYVIGGFSKILKHFIKKYTPFGIKTFCDLRYFNGTGYNAVGFKKSHDSKPNYSYVKNGKRYSRYMYQKHRLKNKLNFFDAALSEKENMKANGYLRIYDCGNRVFELECSNI